MTAWPWTTYVRQTRRLVAELQATRSPEAAVRRALERVGEQISGILQRAHETAEQITAQSRSEAEDRLEQARIEAAQIADAAEQRVSDLDADTDRIWLERQRIVADAEDLAAQLLALAKTAAERFPADAADAAARLRNRRGRTTVAAFDPADEREAEPRPTRTTSTPRASTRAGTTRTTPRTTPAPRMRPRSPTGRTTAARSSAPWPSARWTPGATSPPASSPPPTSPRPPVAPRTTTTPP